jgi:predicted RNA-binding Zn-ribbon protein involved in translation (DUF1610 family)
MNQDSTKHKLSKNYAMKLFLCVLLSIIFSAVLFSDEIVDGYKILILLSGGVFLYIIQLIFYQKNSELKCPNCNKRVLLKPSYGWKKYEPYENCYSCGKKLK